MSFFEIYIYDNNRDSSRHCIIIEEIFSIKLGHVAVSELELEVVPPPVL